MTVLYLMFGFVCMCSAIETTLSLMAFFEKKKLSHELTMKVDKAGEMLEKNAPFINTFMSHLFATKAAEK